MKIDQNVIQRAQERTIEGAQRAQDAAMLDLQQRAHSKMHPGESSIALPFGRKISAKPYTSMRQSTKQNWWLGEAYKLILPDKLKTDYRMPDGTWCLAWPNSTEEGTTMGMAGSGFVPVLWNEIDKSLGARVRTHEGTNGRAKGEGYVYWKRLILVWVEPEIWHDAHVAPILRNLSMLARANDDWAAHVEDASKVAAHGDVIAQGLLRSESEHVTIAT